MRDDQAVRLAASLMDHDKVSEVVSLADLDQVFQHVATAVDTSRVGNDKLQLFLEGSKTLARVSAGGHKDLRVAELGILVLIINMGASHHGVLVGKLEVMSDSLPLLAQLCRNAFVVVNRILHLESLVLCFVLLLLLAFLVEVLFSQPDVSLDHFGSFRVSDTLLLYF